MADQEINTSEEIWKPIPGFAGYEVSDHGRVRSYWRKTAPNGQGYNPGWIIDTEPRKILRLNHTKDGYPCICFQVGGKRKCIRIHQLVLCAFIGPCPDGMQACHNDGKNTNCLLNNLRWDTPLNNSLDKRKHGTILYGEKSGRAILNESQVKQIRRLACGGYGFRMLGRMFSVSHATIEAIVKRKSWKHI